MTLLLVSLVVFGQYSNPKSATVLKQRMDSLENNYWNSSSEVWASSKYHYAYDASGQMTFYYSTYTDIGTGEVIGEERYEYSYNADGSGNQTRYVRYDWDNAGEQWIRRDSSYNTYNDEGLLTEYSGFKWESDQWIIRYFSQYSYEQHGWLSEHISRMWYEADQEWKNNIKFVYAWNEQGELLTKTRFDQEVYDGPWLEEYRLEHIYNIEDQLTTTNSASWITGAWEIYQTDTMSYNAAGLLAENLGYYLDEGSMRPNFRDEYSYDTSGNLTEYIHYYWNTTASSLELYTKNLYSYDPGYSMTDILLPGEDAEWDNDHFPELISNMPLGLEVFDWENESWQDYKKTDYFYSEMEVTGLAEGERELARVRLFPNPVNDLLRVALPEGSTSATLTLYEITGRQVLRRQLDASASLSLATLPAGVYLYTVSIDGAVQSGKLVKR